MRKGDAIANNRHLYEAGLSHKAITVYLYLKDRANKEGTCYPAIGTIADNLSLSESTVRRGIRELEQRRFITTEQRWRENGGKSSLLYKIIK